MFAWTPHGSPWFLFFFRGTGGAKSPTFLQEIRGWRGWRRRLTHPPGEGRGGREPSPGHRSESPFRSKGGLGFRRAGPLSFGDSRHGESGLRKVRGGTGSGTWSSPPCTFALISCSPSGPLEYCLPRILKGDSHGIKGSPLRDSHRRSSNILREPMPRRGTAHALVLDSPSRRRRRSCPTHTPVDPGQGTNLTCRSGSCSSV